MKPNEIDSHYLYSDVTILLTLTFIPNFDIEFPPKLKKSCEQMCIVFKMISL